MTVLLNPILTYIPLLYINSGLQTFRNCPNSTHARKQEVTVDETRTQATYAQRTVHRLYGECFPRHTILYKLFRLVCVYQLKSASVKCLLYTESFNIALVCYAIIYTIWWNCEGNGRDEGVGRKDEGVEGKDEGMEGKDEGDKWREGWRDRKIGAEKIYKQINKVKGRERAKRYIKVFIYIIYINFYNRRNHPKNNN